MLNSVDRFAAAAATPMLLNLFLIAALLLMARFGWHDGQALAWAVTRRRARAIPLADGVLRARRAGAAAAACRA